MVAALLDACGTARIRWEAHWRVEVRDARAGLFFAAGVRPQLRTVEPVRVEAERVPRHEHRRFQHQARAHHQRHRRRPGSPITSQRNFVPARPRCSARAFLQRARRIRATRPPRGHRARERQQPRSRPCALARRVRERSITALRTPSTTSQQAWPRFAEARPPMSLRGRAREYDFGPRRAPAPTSKDPPRACDVIGGSRRPRVAARSQSPAHCSAREHAVPRRWRMRSSGTLEGAAPIIARWTSVSLSGSGRSKYGCARNARSPRSGTPVCRVESASINGLSAASEDLTA